MFRFLKSFYIEEKMQPGLYSLNISRSIQIYWFSSYFIYCCAFYM